MSFIGREFLYIPPGVSVYQKNNYIIARKEDRVLKKKVHLGLFFRRNSNKILLVPRKDKISQFFSKEWGSLRVLLWKMFLGIFNPFSIKLIFIGIGYRFTIGKRFVKMRLGFSHKVCFRIPFFLGLEQGDKRPPSLILTHVDYIKVNTLASQLRALKKPEPYKGKGICFFGEVIYRKVGKKKN